MEEQLSFLRQKTESQIVYQQWLWFMRSMPPERYHPNRATEQTAKYFDMSIERVERITSVQSRWDARRILKASRTKS